MEKILLVDGVTREYPGRVAVDNLSFEVKAGSIHGFLGPNGAGKTTTMKMIAGLLPPTKGAISLFGKKVDPNDFKFKNLLGLLPENPPLFLDMTVEDYLKFVGHLHHVKNTQTEVRRVIDELSLSEVKSRLIGNLSKGFRQRVGLAQAIVYDAPFLILDEPTNGLDPQSVVELREFIKKLSSRKTILFSSHILSEVELLCDHITIIHKGKIRASGDIKEIHQRFRKGLDVRVGVPCGEKLPNLDEFAQCQVLKKDVIQDEQQYLIRFESAVDCRAELGQFLIGKGAHLLTLQADIPELEDIFLQMTEPRK